MDIAVVFVKIQLDFAVCCMFHSYKITIRLVDAFDLVLPCRNCVVDKACLEILEVGQNFVDIFDDYRNLLERRHRDVVMLIFFTSIRTFMGSTCHQSLVFFLIS